MLFINNFRTCVLVSLSCYNKNFHRAVTKTDHSFSQSWRVDSQDNSLVLMSHPQSERREFKMHAQAHFLLFIQSELPAHGRVPPIVRVALPMSINLETPSAAWLKIYFHRDSRSHQVDSQDLPHTTSSSPVSFRLSELLLYCINALDPHLPSSHLMLKHTHCIHVLL